MSNFSDIFNNWMAYAIAVGTWGTIGNVFSLLVVLGMVISFWRASRSKTSAISIEDMFVDDSGKIGGSKMRLNAAFLITAWVIVYQTLHGAMTEWLMAAFLTAFVADRVSSRMASGSATPPSAQEDKNV